jgi:carbamoyl-phosphate synthase large subunit
MAPRKASRGPRVLIADTGGAAGIAVIKALGAEKLDIFSADVDPHASGRCLVDEDRRLLIPKSDRDSWTELVYELCERHRIDVLIPTANRELMLLASARVFFAGVGTKIVLASEKTLRMCFNRWALRRCCEGVVRVSTSRLAWESLSGAEYSINVLACSDGRVIAVVPWAWPKVDSVTTPTGRIVRDQGLERMGRQIAKRLELTSVASIQVKEAHDGELALLKVSPCFPAAMPLAAGGVNLPKLCVDDALGLPLDEGVVLFGRLASLRNRRSDAAAEGVADG